MQIDIEKSQKEIKEHGDYAFPVNVSLEKIEMYEQGSFLWHWHPEIEITWIMDGEIEYHVNEKKYILHAGEGIFCNSRMLHAGYQIGEKTCTYLSITFHPRFIYGYENSRIQEKYVLPIIENEASGSLKLVQENDWQKEMIACMQEIYQNWLYPSDDYELEVHRNLMVIWKNLYHYFQTVQKQTQNSQGYLERLREMIAYIQGHYAEEISLDDIAEAVNLCKSECCRFFKRHMGMTMFEYILFLRIQNSLPYLRQGKTITETAGLVGFTSPAYYGQIFKRYMKCTPREYKNKSN